MILVIGIIGIFSYVNREQISAKFKTAVAKSDNVERYERNTVPTTPSAPNLAVNEDTTNLNKTEDTPIITDKSSSIPPVLEKKVPNKEDDPFGVGLDDPENPMLDAKTSSKASKEKSSNKLTQPIKNFYPENTESDSTESTNKSAKLTSKKSNYAKAYKKKKRKISYKGLEKRISKLEKKLGIKKKSKKKVSLEKRVSRLEKIVKKKK
jgi:hypothetical protein